jgi:hypothetical protein
MRSVPLSFVAVGLVAAALAVGVVASPQASRAAAERSTIELLREEVRTLRRVHFGSVRDPERRAAGIARFAEFTSAPALQVLYEELRRERDDVRMALVEHFAGLGDLGDAALGWVVLNEDGGALAAAAQSRIRTPATPLLVSLLATAMRGSNDAIATRAGSLAGALGATQLIPTMIGAQVADREPRPDQRGDLAWIAIQTQRAYIANVVPVLGGSSGAFQPIIGVIGEGFVFRVTDAIVVSYRTEIHQSLVRLADGVTGGSTSHMGYDLAAWRRWYENEYLPVLAEQARVAERAARAKELEREAERDDDID